MVWWEGGATLPRLVCLPSADSGFADAVQTIFATNPAIASATDLEEALREYFPAVRVHERLISAERYATWYVYRDGHYPSAFGEHSGRIG